jgi:hypothetical protein
MDDDNSVLGFAGLVVTGHSPDAAWREIRDRTANSPEVQRMIEHLKSTDRGRAALKISRQQWAEQGFAPPWDDG